MTIHAGHPFADAEDDPVRRFRGRVGGAVSLWTTGAGDDRAGLTVTSYLLSGGQPPQVLALLDPDSDLAEALERTGTAVVQLLQWPHRDLAEAFAGLFPAPGGRFAQAEWEDTAWGPVLRGVSGWLGVRLSGSRTAVGWSTLVTGAVEHAEVRPEHAPLLHRRGRYLTLGP